MMFDVVHARLQRAGRDAESLTQQLRGILGFGAIFEPLPRQARDAGQVSQRETELGQQIGPAVLVDADVIDVSEADAANVEHLLDGLRREACEMLDAVKPLLGDSRDQLAVAE